MRSDPETKLPDDLRELAAQLADDASHLAARYPARAEYLPVTAKRPSYLRRIAPAAAMLIAVCSMAALALQPWRPSSIAVDRHVNQSEVLAIAAPHENSIPLPNPAGVQEVGFNLSIPADSKLDETQMLRVQLNAFEQVIHRLQQQIDQHEKSEADTQKLVESLQKEVNDLHQRLDERDKAQTR
jgi:hypothetical protein